MPPVLKLGKKILIMTLLLVMPLQGFAASLSHLLCSSSSASEKPGPSHHHGGDSNEVTLHDTTIAATATTATAMPGICPAISSPPLCRASP